AERDDRHLAHSVIGCGDADVDFGIWVKSKIANRVDVALCQRHEKQLIQPVRLLPEVRFVLFDHHAAIRYWLVVDLDRQQLAHYAAEKKPGEKLRAQHISDLARGARYCVQLRVERSHPVAWSNSQPIRHIRPG